MKRTITAVALGLAVMSGVAQANEPVNGVRLAMTTLPGIPTFAPITRASAKPAATPIGERALTAVSEQLDRKLEQRLADQLAARAQ
jgi:hypothetical protein